MKKLQNIHESSDEMGNPIITKITTGPNGYVVSQYRSRLGPPKIRHSFTFAESERAIATYRAMAGIR